MACKFIIIGANESPVFEMDLGVQPQEMPHLAEFILHSSLDLVEDARWKTKEMFVVYFVAFCCYCCCTCVHSVRVVV